MQLLQRLFIKLHLKKPPAAPGREAGKLPAPIEALLTREGVDCAGIITFVKSDMAPGREYRDTFVLFDEKKLYLAVTEEPPLPEKHTVKKPDFTPKLLKLQTVLLTDIDELNVEQALTTGLLTYRKGEEYYALTDFSIGLLEQMEAFRKVFEAFLSKSDYRAYLRAEKAHVCKKCGAPLPPGKPFCDKCVGKSGTVRRLFSFFGDVKGKMVFIIFSILASTLISLFIPKISTQKLYDEVLNAGNPAGFDALWKALLSLVLAFAGLKIFNQLFSLLYEYVIAGMLPKVIYSIKLKIFSAMQRLSVGFFTHKQTGSLMERVTRDSNNIYWFFVNGFPYVVTSLVTVVGILAILFLTSWKLTLAVMAGGSIIIVLYPVFSRIFRNLHHKVWVQNSRLTAKVSDNINGHRIIKAFSKEQEESLAFRKISDTLMRAEIRSTNTESTVFPILSIVVYAMGALTLGYGGVLCVRDGELSVGQLLSFVVYLQMLQSPIEFLSWVTNWWARCVDSAGRVFEIMDTEPDITERDNPVILEPFRGKVELSELQFEYEPARPVIKNLSLTVEAGTMLGIVGKTGAGKTTISNLIARLYDPKAGVVKIDGVDARELSMKQLRTNIGIVSQDIFLFMGTIADNIRYARPDASQSEIIAAAKAASAHDFIMKLPDGYETRVGSGGQDLSGGERQRISIARTIIQNPKILILDEATAAMDTETERNIQNSLYQLKNGRTTIAIAHRLSTLRDADALAVIEEGRLLETGTYEELMAKKGAYYHLYRLQEEALRFIGIGETSDEEDAQEEERTHD